MPGSQEQHDAWEYVKKYSRDLKTHWEDLTGDGIGFTLAGPPGVGKTLLASILAQRAYHAAMQKSWGMYIGSFWRSSTVRFVSADAYANLLMTRMAEQADPSEREFAWDEVTWFRQKARLLVIDDIGSEHHGGTKFVQHELRSTLRLRFDAGLPTILTTNMQTAAEWEEYSKTAWSFLHEAAPMVLVTGPDERKT